MIISAGQWTPQAQDLYDLLILIFSDGSGRGLADLDALQKNSGLSDTEWEDLLQYTIQACRMRSRGINIITKIDDCSLFIIRF